MLYKPKYSNDGKLKLSRFVTFVKAAGDVFIEIDPQNTIQSTDGMTATLTGFSAPQLRGMSLSDLIPAEDRNLVDDIVTTKVKRGRIKPFELRFLNKDKDLSHTIVDGIYMPEQSPNLYLSVTIQKTLSQNTSRQATSGGMTVVRSALILGQKALCDSIIRELTLNNDNGKPCSVTLIKLTDFRKLLQQMHGSERKRLIEKISSSMREKSLASNFVSQLSEEAYGILHERDLDISPLKAAIIDAISNAARLDDKVKLLSATIDLDLGNVPEDDAAKTLLYCVSKFSRSKKFAIKSLSEGLDPMLHETKRTASLFKQAASTSTFDIALQPIVDLRSRETHHHEAFARLHNLQSGSSPFEIISLAEDAGIIADFDIALCTKAIELIKAATKKGNFLAIAVNLSARSIEQAAFLRELEMLLTKARVDPEDLLFEVTETGEITDLEAFGNIIENLRDFGHKVCLDAFGLGISTLQCLRTLNVDVVKFDGLYDREILHRPNGDVFVRSMVRLCNELKIDTIAEMIETEEAANELLELGVQFGQGYYFGKPKLVV